MNTAPMQATGCFDASRASSYDMKIRASIPGYDALHQMTCDLLQLTALQNDNILVVGAGTGMEITHLGSVNPGWKFTAVDISGEMLSICKENVQKAGMSHRVQIHCGNVDSLPEGQVYDAATSILVSHFIRDTGARKTFFREIAGRLLPGGILITADITGGTHESAFDLLFASWKLHYAKAGIPEQEVEADFARSLKTVSFTPETEIYHMLIESGFDNIMPFFRAFLFAGWVCSRK